MRTVNDQFIEEFEGAAQNKHRDEWTFSGRARASPRKMKISSSTRDSATLILNCSILPVSHGEKGRERDRRVHVKNYERASKYGFFFFFFSGG